MIKELTHEEAAQLRERVKNRFLQSPFNGAGFKVNQYKDSYRHLADDIVRAVPNSEASITTNRLRKLFYYTDPSICAVDKLEKPSFGDDFIQVLFKYIKSEIPSSLSEKGGADRKMKPDDEKEIVGRSLPKFQNPAWKWAVRIWFYMASIATIALFIFILSNRRFVTWAVFAPEPKHQLWQCIYKDGFVVNNFFRRYRRYAEVKDYFDGTSLRNGSKGDCDSWAYKANNEVEFICFTDSVEVKKFTALHGGILLIKPR